MLVGGVDWLPICVYLLHSALSTHSSLSLARLFASRSPLLKSSCKQKKTQWLTRIMPCAVQQCDLRRTTGLGSEHCTVCASVLVCAFPPGRMEGYSLAVACLTQFPGVTFLLYKKNSHTTTTTNTHTHAHDACTQGKQATAATNMHKQPTSVDLLDDAPRTPPSPSASCRAAAMSSITSNDKEQRPAEEEEASASAPTQRFAGKTVLIIVSRRGHSMHAPPHKHLSLLPPTPLQAFGTHASKSRP